MSDNHIYYNDVINNNPFTISPAEYDDTWLYVNNKLVTKLDLMSMKYNKEYILEVVKDIANSFHVNERISCRKEEFEEEDVFILNSIGMVNYKEIINKAILIK